MRTVVATVLVALLATLPAAVAAENAPPIPKPPVVSGKPQEKPQKAKIVAINPKTGEVVLINPPQTIAWKAFLPRPVAQKLRPGETAYVYPQGGGKAKAVIPVSGRKTVTTTAERTSPSYAEHAVSSPSYVSTARSTAPATYSPTVNRSTAAPSGTTYHGTTTTTYHPTGTARTTTYHAATTSRPSYHAGAGGAATSTSHPTSHATGVKAGGKGTTTKKAGGGASNKSAQKKPSKKPPKAPAGGGPSSPVMQRQQTGTGGGFPSGGALIIGALAVVLAAAGGYLLYKRRAGSYGGFGYG